MNGLNREPKQPTAEPEYDEKKLLSAVERHAPAFLLRKFKQFQIWFKFGMFFYFAHM